MHIKTDIFIGLICLVFTSVQLSAQHQWTRTNPGGGGAIAMVTSAANGNILVASDLSGVYESSDDGLSWEVRGATQGLLETHVSCIGAHPTDGDTYFAGTYRGVFKTSDGGDSFNQVFPLPGSGIDYSYAESIVLAPSDPSIGYLTHHPSSDAMGEVYKTIDGGDNWQSIPGEDMPEHRILKLMVHRTDADLVYALTGKSRWGCSDAQLLRSTDGGVHWTQIGGALGDVLDMDLHPTDSDVIYLSTFLSNFTDPTSCMSWDMGSYAGGDEDSGELYKSTDGGASFVQVSDKTGIISVGLQDPEVVRLIDPLWPYEWNSNAGTWESLNGGNTWTHTGYVENWNWGYSNNQWFAFSGSFNGLGKSIMKDPFNSDRFYGSFGQWAWASFDGGETLNNISTQEITAGHYLSTGVENIEGHCLEVNEANPDIVYMGAYDIGFWISVDHGGSWIRSLPNYNVYPSYVWNLGDEPVDPVMAVRDAGSNVLTVLSDPEREEVVWASFSKQQYSDETEGVYAVTGLFKSMAYGENWQLMETGLPNGEQSIRMYGLSLDINSPMNNRTLYVTIDGDLYKSVNDGLAWSMIFANGGLKFTEVNPTNGNIVYAGGKNGLWKSIDAGSSWEEVGIPAMRQTSTYIRPDIVPTWTEYGAVTTYPWEGVFDIEIDPNVADRLYVVALGPGKGLYRSNDAGATWSLLLQDDVMRGVSVAPANSNFVYVTSSMNYHSGGYGNSLGILYTDNANVSTGNPLWQEANEGMAWKYGGAIEVEGGDSPRVWAWSPGTGVQWSVAPLFPSCPADLDGSGVVDVNDFLILNSSFGDLCNSCPADLTGDGQVDINDFIAFNSDFGLICN